MSTAFILIPGGSLALEDYIKLDQQAIDNLVTLMGPANFAYSQAMPFETFERAPHLVWLWRVLSRTDEPPATAPWKWTSLGGHTIAPELWQIQPLTLNNGVISNQLPQFTEEEIPQLLVGMESALFDEGFRLQVWDHYLFASRQEKWTAATMPVDALPGMKYDDIVTVGESDRHMALCEKLLAAVNAAGINEKRKEQGLPTIDKVFITGGGVNKRFNPPTLIRSVLANDPVILGWADAAGIPKPYLKAADKGVWDTTVPAGDVIAVIDDLYEPWLARDMKAWSEALPKVIEKVNALRKAAVERQHEATLLIMFSNTHAVTLAVKKRKFFARLFKKEVPMHPDIWCPEEGTELPPELLKNQSK